MSFLFLPHSFSAHCFPENRGSDDFQHLLEKYHKEYAINSITGVFLLSMGHLSILVIIKEPRIRRHMIAHRNETNRHHTQTSPSIPTAMRGQSAPGPLKIDLTLQLPESMKMESIINLAHSPHKAKDA
jgi:hypothetical protein